MDVNKERLFLGSCFALIATSVGFGVVGAIMGALKAEFSLSNEDIGYIGGAALWGFTISIFVLGPLCDVLGMRNLLRFALICHAAGALIMIFANGYWMLFAGALILAMGNGAVEAACNPLVITVYPDQKTKKLNQFHVWFPGGIVIGSVASFLLNWAEVGDWRIKIAMILAPTIVYGILFAAQKFPATERVQSGLSFGKMVEATLARPLFLILLACMVITASLELGPNRWVTAVLEAGGMHGTLVLAYISGLMAVLRFFAGPVVHRLSPTGILVLSAVLSGIGLFWLSFASNIWIALAASTVFAVGVCYFWPTMLGVTSERVPKSGALGLALMGGMGMLAVGLVTAPQMGKIADDYLHDALPREETVDVLQQVIATYPSLANEMQDPFKSEANAAVSDVAAVLAEAGAGDLPAETANAMRGAISNAPKGDAAAAVVEEIKSILNPADNYGGRMSFRYVAPFSILIIIVFGVMYLRDRAAGGYKAESLAGGDVDASSEDKSDPDENA